uniref:Ig-like domain-containing protein n=1 Tax=Chelonoidis abingdonii TaxID=106734 RepID=A0A8C0GVT0_CHEAB
MGAGWILGARSCWAGALLVTVTVLRTHLAHCTEPEENFLYQEKWDCYLPTGTGGVRFVWRGIYAGSNHHFRQRPGVFEAERSWGARHRRWNKDPTSWRRSAAVDTFCRHNYGRSSLSASTGEVERRVYVQPKVKVSPTKSGSPPHPHLLVCSVTGFYPSGIEIKWLKNGQEQTAGVVSTELLQNGDWTFQILVMLEMSPRRGDVYTCQVEHISLQGPLTVHWEAQSDSARSKMLTGVGGFMLGLIFLAPGLLIYLKNKKGERSRLTTPSSPSSLLSSFPGPGGHLIPLSPTLSAGTFAEEGPRPSVARRQSARHLGALAPPSAAITPPYPTT